MDKDALYSRDWHVAVMDFNYEFEGEGTTAGTHYISAGKDGGSVIAGLFAAELARIKNIKIIERSQIAKLMEEQAMQQSGISDAETAIKIGKLAGAQAVVLGQLTDYVLWDNLTGAGSTISFSARMIDVESGRVILNGAISRARTLVDAFANVQLTSKELVDSILQN